MKAFRAALAARLLLCACGPAQMNRPGPFYVPYRASGIYAPGEPVGWHVTLPWNAPAVSYVIRKNNLAEIGRGTIKPGKPHRIEVTLDEPAMVYVEVTENTAGAKPRALGAAVAPEKIQPSIPAPADFDAFWKAKIAALRKVPAKPVLTRKAQLKRTASTSPSCTWITSMAVTSGASSQSRTTPTNKKKYPGLLLLQWASPPYPLQKSWVTDRAAEGWLTLNIEPHDVMPDQPKEYYDALPKELKEYNTIETRNRDGTTSSICTWPTSARRTTSRAGRTGMARPWWSWEPAWAVSKACAPRDCTRRSRPCSSMFLPAPTSTARRMDARPDIRSGTQTTPRCWRPRSTSTPRIARRASRCPSLVSMGFIDTATPPVGIWAAFNQIQGPKQAAPMTDSPHNHLATPEQSLPWTRASAAWLSALLAGRPPIERADVATPRTDENSRLAHEHLLAKRKAGQIDVYFIGDSITRRWGTSDAQYQDLLANWNANFKGWNAANFGWGADKTQHMLWRLQNGELDGVNPKVVVLMAGTNNIGNASPLGDVEARAADVSRGVAALVREVRKRAPGATLILTGITPRNDNIDVMPVVNAANRQDRRAGRWKVHTLHKHQRTTRASRTTFCATAWRMTACISPRPRTNTGPTH